MEDNNNPYTPNSPTVTTPQGKVSNINTNNGQLPKGKVMLLAKIIALFFLVMVALMVVFVIIVKNHTANKESSFVDFVKKTIAQNEDPSSSWVNNTTKNSTAFQTTLSLIRKAAKDGSYNQVSSYSECKTIVNSREYIVNVREEFCAAKMCNSSPSQCLYIIAYLGEGSTKRRSGSNMSLEVYKSTSEADAKIATLLRK